MRDRGVVQEVVVGRGGIESVGEGIPFAYPEDDLPALVAALASAIHQGRWRGRRVAVAIAAHWCDHWIATLPPVKERHLPLLVQREVVAHVGEGALPTWGYEVHPASAAGPSTVVVTSADGAVIAAAEAAIRTARCVPVCATTSQIAGLARLRHPDQLDGLGVVVQITIGRHETGFVVFEEGRLLFSRTLMRGLEPEGDPEGRSVATAGEQAQLEQLALEIQRSILYVKREIRRPLELAIMGGIPRSWEWVKEQMRLLVDLPLGWETLPLDQSVAGRCEESLRLIARGGALTTCLSPTLNLFPKRTVDERHPRAGMALAAAALLVWLAAAAGIPRIVELHHRLAADGEARARAATQRTAIAARVEPDYPRLVAARAEIERYLKTMVGRRQGPDPAEALARLGVVAAADTLLLAARLERSAHGWTGTLDGAVIAANGRDAAAAYERLLGRLEQMPGVTLNLSSRQRVPPEVGGQGSLRLAGESTTYPFELRLSFANGDGV